MVNTRKDIGGFALLVLYNRNRVGPETTKISREKIHLAPMGVELGLSGRKPEYHIANLTCLPLVLMC